MNADTPSNDPVVVDLDVTSRLHYTEGFVDNANANRLYEHCMQHCDWVQSEIQVYGKRIAIPRLNAWIGDSDYAYSGTSFAATAWTSELFAIKTEIERASQLQLNSVLANLYRDGNDSMGWHSDDEKSLGTNPQIASLSLGQERRFVLRDKKTKKEKVEVTLEHGSLLLMLGDVQTRWQHALPKSKKVREPRINLTFRLCHSN